jgi:hypothetical protein
VGSIDLNFQLLKLGPRSQLSDNSLYQLNQWNGKVLLNGRLYFRHLANPTDHLAQTIYLSQKALKENPVLRGGAARKHGALQQALHDSEGLGNLVYQVRDQA